MLHTHFLLVWGLCSLSLGTTQQQNTHTVSTRWAGFSLVTIRFGLAWFGFLLLPPLLFINKWYLSKHPALGSWLMGPSSWISSLHLARPHLLQIANKKCFYFLHLKERGREGLHEMRLGQRKRENLGQIAPLSAVILHMFSDPIWPCTEKKNKVQGLFSFFTAALLSLTQLFHYLLLSFDQIYLPLELPFPWSRQWHENACLSKLLLFWIKKW